MEAVENVIRIYYTGGLYSGLGATVRGIPSEDILNGTITPVKFDFVNIC